MQGIFCFYSLLLWEKGDRLRWMSSWLELYPHI